MTDTAKTKPPKYLYRYRPSLNEQNQEHIKRLFTNHEIGFVSPAVLNDPFDCRSFELTWEGRTREEIESFLWIVANKNPELNAENKFYWVQDQLKNKSYKSKNHLEQNREFIITRIIAECRILCFSETNNNILMWSHYASGHKGFCLVFNTEKDEMFNHAYVDKVNYPIEQNYPKVNFAYDKDALTVSGHIKPAS